MDFNFFLNIKIIFLTIQVANLYKKKQNSKHSKKFNSYFLFFKNKKRTLRSDNQQYKSSKKNFINKLFI